MGKQHQDFIREAIKMAKDNVESGLGGPFGALLVKDGRVIGRGVNRVTSNNDPSAHAEVEAIRDACRNTGHYWLKDAVIYASCEPCPMCLGAIYWARIKTIYYAADNNDAARAGFDDSFIYREFALPRENRSIPSVQLPDSERSLPFDRWIQKEDKTGY
ncbi:MAG: nucleoside deaminase [Bacteroidales bacterium]